MDRWLIDITFNSPVVRDAKTDTLLRNELIEWIGSWRKLLATRVNMQVTEEQINMEVGFIIEYYPLLTLKELGWLQTLYMQRDLPVDYGDIVVFNPDFLARVIKAYRVFKRDKSHAMVQEVERQRFWKESEGTPAMNADGMRYMIERVEREIREQATYVYMLRDVFNYFVRTDLMEPGLLGTSEMNSEEAKAYVLRRRQIVMQAQARGRTEISMKDLMKGFSLSSQELERLDETLAIEWTLKQFFATHPVKDVLKSVSAKHWEPQNKKG